PALIQRMAKTFQKSDGDIREVLRTMIYSPEFWSRGAYRAKVKKPFELVVSSVRALGTDVDTPMPLVQWVGRIGEPLYQCQPSTGPWLYSWADRPLPAPWKRCRSNSTIRRSCRRSWTTR